MRTSYDVARLLVSLPRIVVKQRQAGRPKLVVRKPAARRHPDSWVDLEQCGASRPYVKTFEFESPYIGGYHSKIANATTRSDVKFGVDLGLDGFLAHAEALKVYELAYFGDGDFLELGTYRGLSTSIIARALHDRQRGALYTCDISPRFSLVARIALRFLPGRDRVRFHVGDAAGFLDRMIGERRRFGFVFVDHWHGYDATHAVGMRLSSLLLPGGFAMFHDYNDTSARDPAHPDKVFQAVRDTVGRSSSFQFCCVTASSAVFQFQPAAALPTERTTSYHELSVR